MPLKSLKTNALLNTVQSVLSIIFPLISFPYVSRVLGVDNIGVYNFSASIVSYFLLIAGLGISTYAIREGAQYRNNRLEMEKFVSEVFSINVLSTCISYIFLFASLLLIPKLEIYKTPILVLSVEIVFTTIGVSWCCNIYEDFLFSSIRSMVTQVFSICLLFLFVKEENDVLIYCCIVVFANVGANLINYFYIRKRYVKFSLTIHPNFKKHLKPILIIFLSSIAISIYVSSDTTMIGFMLDDTQVGLYGTSVKIYNIVKMVLVAVLVVLIPRFSILLNTDETEQSKKLFSNVFNVLNAMLLPAIVGLFMMSEEILYCIAGSDFVAASTSLKILSIAAIFSLYAYLYTQCILIPVRRENVVFKATLISAIVNIGLNFLFIPLLGINGAAITTVIAEIIVFIISLKCSSKYIKLQNIMPNSVSIIFGCLGIVIVCILGKSCLPNMYLRLAVSIFGAVCVYFVIMLLTKNSIVITELKKITQKMSNRRNNR